MATIREKEDLEAFGYDETRFDFLEEEVEEIPTCAYCDCEGTTENPIITRKFKLFNKPKTELICQSCLNEELAYESEERASAALKRRYVPTTRTGTPTSTLIGEVGSVTSALRTRVLGLS